MKIEKVGGKLTVVIPEDVAEAFGLHEGDTVEVRRSEEVPHRLSEAALAELHARMTALSRPLPEGYRFDREEANAR